METSFLPRPLRNGLLAAVAVLPLASCVKIEVKVGEPTEVETEEPKLALLPDASALNSVTPTRLYPFATPGFQAWLKQRTPTDFPLEPLPALTEPAETLADIIPPAPFKRDEVEELPAAAFAPESLAAVIPADEGHAVEESPTWELGQTTLETCHPGNLPSLMCPALLLAPGTALQPPQPAVQAVHTLSNIPLPHRKPARAETTRAKAPAQRIKQAPLRRQPRPVQAQPEVPPFATHVFRVPPCPQGFRTCTVVGEDTLLQPQSQTSPLK